MVLLKCSFQSQSDVEYLHTYLPSSLMFVLWHMYRIMEFNHRSCLPSEDFVRVFLTLFYVFCYLIISTPHTTVKNYKIFTFPVDFSNRVWDLKCRAVLYQWHWFWLFILLLLQCFASYSSTWLFLILHIFGVTLGVWAFLFPSNLNKSLSCILLNYNSVYWTFCF